VWVGGCLWVAEEGMGGWCKGGSWHGWRTWWGGGGGGGGGQREEGGGGAYVVFRVEGRQWTNTRSLSVCDGLSGEDQEVHFGDCNGGVRCVSRWRGAGTSQTCRLLVVLGDANSYTQVTPAVTPAAIFPQPPTCAPGLGRPQVPMPV
jgi:hypothetical protein